MLDQDHERSLQWGRAESDILRARLAESSDRKILVAIASYEEQIRGWMALLAKTPDVKKQVEAYSRLRKHLQLYCSIPLLDFSELAADKFIELRRHKIRIGTMDLKIAASCLCENALLLTRNTIDYSKIPGLRFEDWTR